MAKAPVEIGVTMDTKGFQQEVESGIVRPLDDAERAFKDLEKSADKSGDQIERSLEQAQKETRDAAKETERYADRLRQANREGRQMGEGTAEGARRSGNALDDFSKEAKQNLSETVSSFRGDIEDLPQFAQDVLGGVVGELGVVGAGLGAAGAVGIGLITAAFIESEEESQEFRERVAELADELIEAGATGEVAIGDVVERMRTLATETDTNRMSLARLRDASDNSVTSYEDLALALSGYGSNLDELIEKEKADLELLEDSRGARARRSEQMKEELGDQRAVVEALTEQKTAMEEAQKIEQAWVAAGGEALAARATALDTLQGELDEGISKWSEYTNAETGASDPTAYLAAFQARMDATANFNSNVQDLAAKFGLSFEETQAILDQGVDFAPMLQSIRDNGLEADFVAKIQAAVGGGQEIIDGTPLGATVEVAASTETAAAQIDEAAQDRETEIVADADTESAAQKLDSVAEKKREALITASVDLSAANNAMANFMNRQRTVTVFANVVDREGKPVS